jgi:hypothetical protein
MIAAIRIKISKAARFIAVALVKRAHARIHTTTNPKRLQNNKPRTVGRPGLKVLLPVGHQATLSVISTWDRDASEGNASRCKCNHRFLASRNSLSPTTKSIDAPERRM